METELEDKLKFIKTRKSIRNFVSQKIEKQKLEKILECGRWAPSGLNNQPWKVNLVLDSAVKQKLRDCTKYGKILGEAYANIVVFLDKKKGYNRVKDIQAIGAFMENMILAAHGLKLGAVWIGEILNQKEQVNEIFKLNSERYELMGVIALGHIDSNIEKKKQKERERRPLEDFVDWF